jgi:ABC-type xylose transport system permease subunit
VLAVIAMLGLTLAVMAAPRFGSDFGAALAGAPAFALFAWLLLGRRVRVRTVAILVGLIVVAGLTVGVADMLRPVDQQTHVGRLFDKLANGQFGDFMLTIRRKLIANLDSFTNTKFLWVLPIVGLLLWFLWRDPAGRARAVCRAEPVVRQTLLTFAVAAFLGYALNDSGVAIPALMAVVLECAVVYVLHVAASAPSEAGTPAGGPRSPDPQDPREVDGSRPDQEPVSVGAGT